MVKNNIAIICGASGQPNLGDEIIASYVAKFYIENGYQTLVNGFTASELALRFSINKIDAAAIDWFWKNTPPNLQNISDAIESGCNIFKHNRMPSDPLSMYQSLLSKTNIFHLHGSGYINSIWPNSAFLIGVAIAFKRKFKTKIIATGQGLLPLNEEDTKVIIPYINEFDIFEVRDIPSYETLTKNGTQNLINGVDDAFLYEDVEPKNHKKPNLHINLQNDDFMKDSLEENIKLLNEYIDKFGDMFGKIIFWEFLPNSDRKTYDLLKSIYGRKITIKRYYSTLKDGIKLGKNDFAICSRFHAHLLFAKLGIKGYYVCGNDVYYKIKHETLVKLGSKWQLFANNNISDFKKFISTTRNNNFLPNGNKIKMLTFKKCLE